MLVRSGQATPGQRPADAAASAVRSDGILIVPGLLSTKKLKGFVPKRSYSCQKNLLVGCMLVRTQKSTPKFVEFAV